MSTSDVTSHRLDEPSRQPRDSAPPPGAGERAPVVGRSASEPGAAASARGGAVSAARVRALRARVRLRRRAAWALLAAPVVLVVVLDLARRGDRLAALRGKYVASYAAAIVESALLWGLLLFAASARRGALRWLAAGLFVAFAAVAVGGQLYFHRQYSIYLNLDATLFGTSFSESLFGQLKADGRNFLTSVAPPLCAASLLVWSARALVRPRNTGRTLALRWLSFVAAAAVFVVPCSYRSVQASTPDVIYFHAIGGLVKELTGVRATAQVRPGVRTPPKLPPLRRAPPPTAGSAEPSGAGAAAHPGHRNVLFIITESVRADAGCSAYVPSCPTMPRTNEAVPGRSPLRQMRASSSTTAIELAVLWSGLQPTASREALHTAPLLFDYAHAAGYDAAYWTSHHMMFANSRLYVQDLPTSHQCGATDLDPLADIDVGARDDLLTERIRAQIPRMREPFFAVAHFGNTHVPYRIDPKEAPFTPFRESKAPEDNEAYRNYYLNAVHLQDRAIADLIRFVRASPLGERTVIVFTSDHGEAFREHGQLGHTGAVLDEEIHVPAWIDAPPGILGAAEAEALRSAENAYVSHADLTPTILDLLGLWNEPGIEPHRASMVGTSLLRERPREPRALALSNCTGIWGCAFRNWGMMRGSLKLEAREFDRAWHCYDVAADPAEQHDLGQGACGDLARLADGVFGGPPGVVADALSTAR